MTNQLSTPELESMRAMPDDIEPRYTPTVFHLIAGFVLTVGFIVYAGGWAVAMVAFLFGWNAGLYAAMKEGANNDAG